MSQSKHEELDALVKKVDRPDAKPADVGRLRALLSQTSEVQFYAKVTESAYKAVVKQMSHTPFTEIAVERACADEKVKLGYDEASPIERMLIDAVILAWLRYTQIEQSASRVWGQSHDHAQGTYWDRRLSAAQRRYLRAIETLARVRRLGVPMLQVNIAEKQQVNVG